ncbi:probable G-protein coupled receptor 75 [Canis lupus baileyi]|uniref:G protein-coupled receptor 75 n=3 Tax=Canis lupus TaxID=9612 RepID=A0A8I3MYF8_CANLF|nr:probable G-protein coupled receptor 75 isoform X1 [Canis lupus familiaris]XP_038497004.1 probable G-protein coupled receptor 75 isoform X1 [Canis lupus familiaris]XP_038534824.1 probable G-protein coupled receptor 75 isoform X1 [Canis lupus familiaris]XP_048971029.1 probable G-protein coupled receptor 75 [Canis lupus dingo]
MNDTEPLEEAPNGTLLRGPRPQGGPQDLVHTATLVTCTLLLAVVFCLGSYGNLIVFLSFFDPAFRKFRTNFDFMVLNLSFCDLFICGVTAPMFAFALFRSARGLPDAFCFAFHATSSGFVIMSLKTVAAIALHRLRMVLGRQPSRPASVPGAALLAALLWASSFTLAALGALRASKAHLCLPLSGLPAAEGAAALSLYAVDFGSCVAVVAVSYILIAQTLRRNARARRRPPAAAAEASRAPPPFAGGPGRRGAEPALYRHQGCPRPAAPAARRPRPPPAPAVNLAAAKDSKAVLTCVVIVLSALLCCVPLGAALARGALSRGGGGGGLRQLELLGFALLFLKSGLNPFIYSRGSAGLRRKVLACLRGGGLGACGCRHRTRLRAVGKGNLETNRNKSSHHETNSAYVLSPKPQKKFVDQACGPSQSRESAASPRASAGRPGGQSSSTAADTRLEPYYGVYGGGPRRGDGAPRGPRCPGPAAPCGARRQRAAGDLLRGPGAAGPIPVPSV